MANEQAEMENGADEAVPGSPSHLAADLPRLNRTAGRPPDVARQERRRTEILDAATKVFAQVGFASTDVQQIAAAAGVGKGTVYRYFPSKEELFLAAVDQGMQRLTANVNAAASFELAPLDRIAAGVTAYLTWFDRHPEMVELFIQERAQFRDRQRPTYFAHRDANLGPWRELIASLIREGVIRDLPVESVLEVLSDLLYGTMFTNRFTNREALLSSQCARILDIVLHGLLASPQASGPTQDHEPRS
jgi:AcrR family transcriptional regulator